MRAEHFILVIHVKSTEEECIFQNHKRDKLDTFCVLLSSTCYFQVFSCGHKRAVELSRLSINDPRKIEFCGAFYGSIQLNPPLIILVTISLLCFLPSRES